ncbi:MAG TPA: CBS domain-containing protein [Candidatus Syntrophoarchaeum butanivorans]|uniref:CBS domain pair protein n=1 Tax=Candidatus Syntropharchaeum butanivorans TaxID=1839936 RepID=A0A1F2P6N2_9EURY|nr:MAG: CBS domain pair protein [Candidatus Syntrophoarchaeum butanivorans]HDM36554.1 CBS domain-containing protein [Candidatus Syntrophoarchaeum butanivorans]HEC57751.1 CBS domain-containing protein [Candidatus Syntrophoarchaeum butanivorans]
MRKTIDEINERIRDGSVSVVTADRMSEIVEEIGAEKAAKEVDVVTTGTFGAMCSSGAFLNFGHSDPPIKMVDVWLNDVRAYGGIAAVDVFIGATERSRSRGEAYGGGHVIEDLVAGREIEVYARSPGTDCYPQREIETRVRIDDLNQAIMLNPRNAYQRYAVATNSTERMMETYMGSLFPHFQNATYSGSGELSPICNDPNFETIGIGTRIFLCGGEGYIIGEGTQHNPKSRFSTLMVKGDMKQMDPAFLRGATFRRYGTTLYVGLGVPIPILNEKIAANTGVKDEDIITEVLDYGVPRRDRPVLGTVSYRELKSGEIEIQGRVIKTYPLSSHYMAKKVAETLATWIKKGEFFLTEPVKPLPLDTIQKPMRETKRHPLVMDVMVHEVVTVREDYNIQQVAKVMVDGQITHAPVVSRENKLVGILTAWDIAKVVAQGREARAGEIMTRKVLTTQLDEPVEVAARKIEKYNISALPVVDSENHVIGIITGDMISRLIGRK